MKYYMGNFEDGYDVESIGKTIRDKDNNYKALIISKEFAKALGIENSKVSMTLLNDIGGNKHLLVTKFQKEIVID
jgi:hypothetical protein